MNCNPILPGLLLLLCISLILATYFTLQLSWSVVHSVLHMCNSGILWGTINFTSHTCVQRGNKYTRMCFWWTSVAATPIAGCVSVDHEEHAMHLDPKSRFIYKSMYLQLCYQSSHPWKHRISYSGQLQGRFNFRLMFSTRIVHSTILSLSLTDIIPSKHTPLLATDLLGKRLPGAQSQA